MRTFHRIGTCRVTRYSAYVVKVGSGWLQTKFKLRPLLLWFLLEIGNEYEEARYSSTLRDLTNCCRPLFRLSAPATQLFHKASRLVFIRDNFTRDAKGLSLALPCKIVAATT